MRLALLIAAALPLAACVVDVEGAPCETPGETRDCPPGQACGNGGTCSERAAACASTRCTPGEARCIDGTASVESCSREADPVCGAWVVESCTFRGLQCVTRAGMPSACECDPFLGSEFAAGDGGSLAAGVPPYPTGAAAPAECRFGRLGDALEAAAVHAAASGPAIVQTYAPTGAPFVFGTGALPENFPLLVPAGVTLRGSSAPAGPTSVRADGVSSAAIVSLQGAVEGVRFESVSMTGPGISVSCAAAGVPSLKGVAVDGALALTAGIAIQGLCGATLEGVDVSGVAGPALRVDAASGAPVRVKGSWFRSSDVGVEVRGGAVILEPAGPIRTEVTDNVFEGVFLTGSTRIDGTLDRVVVAGNGGTGVLVRSVPLSSTLTVTGSDVESNGAVSPTTYGGALPRTAGGMLLSQLSLAAHGILGNRFYANSGDQLAFESSGAWSISPGACGATSNAFGNCPGQGAAVSKVGAGTVNARYTVWPGTPPDGFVFGTVDSSLYCDGPPAPAVPTCP